MGSLVELRPLERSKAMDPGLAPFLEVTDLTCGHIEELVDYYVDGDLPLTLHSRFERHLCECELCRSLVEDVQKIVEIARTLDREPIPVDVRDRLRKRLEQEFRSSEDEKK